MTETKKYLWTYHAYTYGNDTKSYTDPVITGVYGKDGTDGLDGVPGTDGTDGTDGISISEVVPLYYASSSSTEPPPPKAEVTRTATTAGDWTKSIPALTSTNKYLYTCDQVKYSNNIFKWTTVVKDNATTDIHSRLTSAELKITDSAIISTVTSTTDGKSAINSLIDQRADSIRLKANKISWDSDYSTMTSDGKLSCTGASINGTIESIDGNDKVIMTTATLSYYRNSSLAGEIRIGDTDGVNICGNNTNRYFGIDANGVYICSNYLRLYTSPTAVPLYGYTGDLKFKDHDGVNRTFAFHNGFCIGTPS